MGTKTGLVLLMIGVACLLAGCGEGDGTTAEVPLDGTEVVSQDVPKGGASFAVDPYFAPNDPTLYPRK